MNVTLPVRKASNLPSIRLNSSLCFKNSAFIKLVRPTCKSTPAEKTSDDSTKDVEDISVEEARSPAEKPHEDSLIALRTE